MSKLKILEWPNPALSTPCTLVEKITPEIVSLTEDLLETLAATKNAVGLSAPQVGVLLRIFVMKVYQPYVMINPEIVKVSDELEIGIEGCLSFTNKQVSVKRRKKLTVKFLDTQGISRKLKFTGLEARCIAHEIDHLNGVVFIIYEEN